MDISAAEQMALRLIAEHNAEVGFRWDNAKARYGQMSHNRTTGKHTMSLSRPLTAVRTEEQVRTTILHEIAHSIAGVREGHGAVWRAEMRRLGLRPDRCGDIDDAALMSLPGAMVAVCSAGHVGKRVFFRRTRKIRSCGTCSPRFDRRYLVTLVPAKTMIHKLPMIHKLEEIAQ